MSGDCEALDRQTVTAEEIKRKLTQPEDGSVVYPLHNARITGELDLRHCTVKVAVDIQNCKFEDKVDLNYCEFKQTVNLSRCTFCKKFNSGDEDEAYTIYRKDLICKGTIFKEDACFAGAQVKGDAHFSKATFEEVECKTVFRGKANFGAFKCDGYGFFTEARFKSEEGVDFEHASFDGSLWCDRAVFKGKASFHGIRCGSSGVFEKARFRSKGEINFDDASFGSSLLCEGTEFGGIARFESARCGEKATFDNAKFLSESGKESSGYSVTFLGASFGELTCRDTIFKGPVDFNVLKCSGNASFERARFKSREQGSSGLAVNFTLASFGGQLDCSNTKFKRPVSFNSIRCNGDAFFKNARFKSRGQTSEDVAVNFTMASLGGQLDCSETVFKGSVSFNSVECKDTGFFNNAQFRSGKLNLRYASFGRNLNYHDATIEGEEADFRFLHVGSSLAFQRAYFATDVKLSHAHIAMKLCLDGSYFKKEVDLYGTEITILELMDVHHDYPIRVRATERQGSTESVVDTPERLERISKDKQHKEERKRVIDRLYPFKGTSLNLSNTTFKRFHGGPYPRLQEELALKLAEGQDPEKFNRDPYVQLEEFYRSEGNEVGAREIYRKGRCAYRENAKRKEKDGGARWSRRTNIIDWLWKWLTGYGVRFRYLLGAAIFFLVSGMLLFYFGGDSFDGISNAPTQDNETPALVTLLGGERNSNPEPNSKPLEDTLLYRAAHSLDLFLPLVNMHVDEKWEPETRWLQAYVVLHVMVGWLIVPLLVAALAGVMRR